MPELPEVETIRLGLQKYVVGKTIDDVDLGLKKIVTGDTKNVVGSKITDVRRFGKGLVIDLSSGYSLAIHIKLTGQLIYRGPDLEKLENVARDKIGGDLPNKWTHVIFKLRTKNEKLKTESEYLYYNDLRQFGWIKIIKTKDIDTLPFFKGLGPEPPVLKTSNGKEILTLEMFEKIVKKSGVSIKPLLMDQTKIGGVGNIYANDALFDAKIDPRRKAKDLNDVEIKKLYSSIIKVLKLGLENHGATELNFVNVLGQAGGYQDYFLVYGRDKKPCKVCKTLIEKIKLGGRGTYFCPKCQK